MKSIISTIALVIGLTGSILAQNLSSSKGQGSFGIGTGLPYGGFGGRLSYNPANQLTLFAGFGYNLTGLGTNFGFQYIFPTQNRTEFYFTGMYGYNAVLKIVGAIELNEIYYGPSLGLGFKINSLRKEGAYWDIGLLVPVRSSEYSDDVDTIKNLPNLESFSKPWPIVFSVGYHFPLNSKKIK